MTRRDPPWLKQAFVDISRSRRSTPLVSPEAKLPAMSSTEFAQSELEASVIDPKGTPYERYWQTAFERHRIWHRRFVLKLPAPWTTDPVMRTFSFTNLYRELDRGTIYYTERILKPLVTNGATDGDLLAITTAYRLFNKVATWEACFEPMQTGKWDWSDCEQLLRDRAKVDSVFTSATMVCAYDGKPGRDKIERVCLMLAATFKDRERHARDLKNADTPSEAWERLTQLPGIGPFLAYEIYSDLLYLQGRFFAWDEDAWANAGPGCQRGLKILWPGRTGYLAEMRELRDGQDEAFKKLGLDFRAIALPGREHLTLRSIEHWCCELQKYQRGNTKRKFVPSRGV
jgi:hypothetical protein